MIRNITKSSFFASVILLLTGFIFSTEAQTYVPPNMFDNPILQRSMVNNNIIATGINGLIRSQMMRNTRGGRTTRKSAVADPTSFNNSPANSLTKTLTDKSANNPEQQKQAEMIFDACVKSYWETARDDNFPGNDLAYGFEYFVVNNYHLYKDIFKTLDNYRYDLTKAPNFIYYSREKAIYGQFRQMLGGNPEIKKLSDKQKQQYTEMLAIMTKMSLLMYESGRKNSDEKLMEKARLMAKSNLESLFQTDADNIIISDEGVSLAE